MAADVTPTNGPKQQDTEAAHGNFGSRWSWLLAASALLLVADGRNTIAVAAWLAPACLLRYVRGERAARRLAIAWLVLVVTHAIAYRGMVPIPGGIYYLFMVISGISAILPYAADRLLASRAGGLRGTLIFPCTLVGAQYLYSHGPQGTWGATAYTQAGDLALLQLLSVTGIWGVTFLIGWFAAVVNQSWRKRGELLPITSFCAVFLVLMLGGGARLAFFRPSSPTVRVASLSPAKEDRNTSPDLLPAILAGRALPAQVNEFRSASAATANELLARSEREAAGGAKLIFWSEGAVNLLVEDEPVLLTRGRELAAKDHVYLGMALGTWTPGVPRPLQNKLVLIDAGGRVAWQYLKARPTPGPEASRALLGDGFLHWSDTPYGRVSGAICYDTDFPGLLAQAGASGADIVLSPASDWRAIDPRHTRMASFRAVEQGFNLVRQSKGGLSAGYDYQGKPLGRMDEYEATDLSLVTEVPVKGVRTLYSRWGDWFAWLSIGNVFTLAWYASRRPAVLRCPTRLDVAPRF